MNNPIQRASDDDKLATAVDRLDIDRMSLRACAGAFMIIDLVMRREMDSKTALRKLRYTLRKYSR